jgi:hypothetical protein
MYVLPDGSSETGGPKRVPRRSLAHSPAANPLGSRWGWRGDTAVLIALPSTSLCLQGLPCARRRESRYIQTNDNGATEVTQSSEVINGRKRRGSDSHIRHVLDGTVVIAKAPERSPVGKSGREGYQQPRPRKLTIEDREALRSAATTGRSLRSLAGAFGVSHETIRAVLLDRTVDTHIVAPETVTQKR